MAKFKAGDQVVTKAGETCKVISDKGNGVYDLQTADAKKSFDGQEADLILAPTPAEARQPKQ